MDNKKTGTLITQRRQELGLTQKELGERLHVSDRAVSKWERAAGFPDVSLLEPLADALELSVLELIHGERLTTEEQPSPEAERSVRTAVRELGGRLRQSLGRCRRIIIVLAILLAAGAAALAYLRFGPFQVSAIKKREVSAAEALEAVPYAIITADDFILAQRLLSDSAIGGLLVPVMPSDDAVIPPSEMSHIITIDEETATPLPGTDQHRGAGRGQCQCGGVLQRHCSKLCPGKPPLYPGSLLRRVHPQDLLCV